MAISNKNKERLNNMNKRARDAQLGTVIQTLQNNQNQDLAVGSLVIGDGAGAPSALDAKGDGKIVVGNGTTATSVAVSGDITLANTGAVAIAAGAVNTAKLATGIMLPVSVEDAKTTSVEENVAGLSSAIALAESLRTNLDAHAADAVEHTAADSDNFPLTSPTATDLPTLIALATEMLVDFNAHEADDDADAGSYHDAIEGSDATLASTSAPTTLAECITRLNDIKAKYNIHEGDSDSHDVGGAHTESTADAANGAAILVVDANVSSGDDVSWSILDSGTGSVTGVSAVAADGGITFTFSADPQGDCIISYIAVTTLS